MKNVALYKAPSTRDDYVVWNADDQKLFDKYFDISERLRQAWGISDLWDYNWIADEMDSYCLENMQPTKKFKENMKARLEIVGEELELLEKFEYIDNDTTLENVKEDLKNRIENIIDCDIKLDYKDIVKHDDEYFYRDNVLDSRKIRTTQRYWKSNIEKDKFKNQKEIPERYKKRMKWKVEKIIRQPIIRDYTPRERQKLWNENRVNIRLDDIINNTKEKRLPYPSKTELLTADEIKSERWTDDRRVEFYKKAYKYENMESVDRYENYEREI